MSGPPEAGDGQPPDLGDADLTDDAFLNGRVRLWQPRAGYRAATDPVFLAAACPARRGEQVLDVGCGAGASALCLSARVPGVVIYGVERQAAYAALSCRNAARAGRDWKVWPDDIAAPSATLKAMSFDHIITNPPFYAADAAIPLIAPSKDQAHRETVPLHQWIDFCLRRLRPRGTLTLIHRIERLPEILLALHERAGGTIVFPLWPRRAVPAKRVIVHSVKESRSAFCLSAGMILHDQPGNAFSSAAQAVLRDGAPIELRSSSSSSNV
ncbi:MAG: methyltransferase [Neomegalonema sp.]|nr:methyltransferase [Neomegalonema sp.]